MSTIKTTTLSTQGGSTVPVDTVVNGTAKAWVNFDGTGTVAIRRAFNVSSITDNGTGYYTVNFTTAMVDANYAASITSQAGSAAYGFGTGNNTQTAAALLGIFTITHTGATQDVSNVSVSIFS